MRPGRRWLLPVLSLLIFFGTVGVSQATGTWVTSGRGTGAGMSAASAVPPGALAVTDLKGWMTLRQAADGLGLTPDELVALVAAPAGAPVGPDTALRDLEALVPGFSLTGFRDVVRAYIDRRAGGAAARGGP